MNRTLIVIPDARASSRIDGPDTEQMSHGSRLEYSSLGVDQRNSLPVYKESRP